MGTWLSHKTNFQQVNFLSPLSLWHLLKLDIRSKEVSRAYLKCIHFPRVGMSQFWHFYILGQIANVRGFTTMLQNYTLQLPSSRSKAKRQLVWIPAKFDLPSSNSSWDLVQIKSSFIFKVPVSLIKCDTFVWPWSHTTRPNK